MTADLSPRKNLIRTSRVIYGKRNIFHILSKRFSCERKIYFIILQVSSKLRGNALRNNTFLRRKSFLVAPFYKQLLNAAYMKNLKLRVCRFSYFFSASALMKIRSARWLRIVQVIKELECLINAFNQRFDPILNYIHTIATKIIHFPFPPANFPENPSE